MPLNVYIGIAQADEWPDAARMFAHHSQRFEALSGGVPCLVVPYHHATPVLLNQLAPRTVIISGIARPFARYEVQTFLGLNAWLQTTITPTLAICGGHQLMAFCFSRDLRAIERLPDEPMRSLRLDEPINAAASQTQYSTEHGFYPIDITTTARTDPLFRGIASPASFFEAHYCEVKAPPSDFLVLASTDACRVQAMRHRTRPLYGVQFHPEDYTEDLPAGMRLLENFFRLPAVTS